MPIRNTRRHPGRALALAATLGLVAALAFSGAMGCVLARVAHVPCPGCGTTRTAWELSHGDLAGAAALNPLGLVVAIAIGLVAVDAVHAMWRDGDLSRSGTSRTGRLVTRIMLLALAADILVWGLRFLGWFGGPVPV